MSFSDKFNDLNQKVTELTKNVKPVNYLPFLMYFITFFMIDLFYCRILFIQAIDYPWEISLSKVIIINIVAISAMIFIFPKKTADVLFAVSAAIFHCYGFAQYCYSSQDNNLFRLKTIGVMGEGMKYMQSILRGMPVRIIAGFAGLLLLIAAVTFVSAKFIPEPPTRNTIRLKRIIGTAVFIPSFICVMLIPFFMDKNAAIGYGSFTSYNYRNFLNAVELYDDTDILMLLQRDIVCSVKSIFKSDQDIKSIDNYFSSRPKHTVNEKTNIFKGKNLICVMMESLDYNALNEEYCPNLTRLMNEGICFSEFYSVRFGDAFTFGTEFCVNSGLASSAGYSVPSSEGENPLPLSLGHIFRNNGYTANEFHYNDAGFYNRGNMSRVFGYENYIKFSEYASDKTLNFEIDDTLITDESLYSKLTEGERFLDYVVTYSAHMPYENDDIYNEAIRRHPELAVSDFSDKTGIFRAKAALTDDMAGKLVKRLEADGLLDDTVILFFADHYCSGIGEPEIEEFGCRTPCFIYAKGITPETVDKVCNTTDLLPTIANLFGVGNCDDYAGYDIFSESYEGYAFFPNLSWITNEGYYIQGNEAVSYDGKKLGDEYISHMNKTALDRININGNMLFYDYYREKQSQ